MNERTEQKYVGEVRDNMEMVVSDSGISDYNISTSNERFRRTVGALSPLNWLVLFSRSLGWTDGYQSEVSEGRIMNNRNDKRIWNFLSDGTFLLLVIIGLLLVSIALTIAQPGGPI